MKSRQIKVSEAINQNPDQEKKNMGSIQKKWH